MSVTRGLLISTDIPERNIPNNSLIIFLSSPFDAPKMYFLAAPQNKQANKTKNCCTTTGFPGVVIALHTCC